MQHLDEGTIHSWLDGALSSSEAARAEAHIASCTACAEAVAEARGLIAASSRILLALDEVPNVTSARGAKGARGAGRRVSIWLVRERIAAAVAVIVAGGALAVALSRDGRQTSVVQVASEAARPLEMTVADSPMPPPVVMAEARKETRTTGNVAGRGAAASKPPARDVAAALAAPQTSQVTIDTTARVVTTGVAAARTDDALRSVEVAEAQRAEARDAENQAKSSVTERIRGLAQRRAAAEEPARYAEAGAARGSGGRVAGAEGLPRLVHEEQMTESGREVRRRIYQVEDVLVTLDEQLPTALDLMREASPAPAAPPAQADSASGSTTIIQWTDARGAKLTLTGSAPREQLERIRKLLGY